MELGATAASYLPDDLVVEILARLPAKSLCRFKCVSCCWRNLISNPIHRARFAQTLSGFFFKSGGRGWRLTGLPSSVTPLGRDDGGSPLMDSALSFLPPTYREIEIMDSCNGLLLLLCSDVHLSGPLPQFYVVCNPATREWVALPQPKYTNHCRGNNQVVEDDNDGMRKFVIAVEVYSSKTGTWDVRECEAYWLNLLGRMTYFNGFVHLPVEYEAVASVDPKGQSWRLTKMQDRCDDPGRGYVGHSQGR
ncbi:unnamed protein product [Urochloa decumbens]|uniref:F-box domain-containing protein n=1 Tax=Urochloa decumbens TaxID=240449 RepID=A0ABC9FA30_9POAL